MEHDVDTDARRRQHRHCDDHENDPDLERTHSFRAGRVWRGPRTVSDGRLRRGRLPVDAQQIAGGVSAPVRRRHRQHADVRAAQLSRRRAATSRTALHLLLSGGCQSWQFLEILTRKSLAMPLLSDRFLKPIKLLSLRKFIDSETFETQVRISYTCAYFITISPLQRLYCFSKSWNNVEMNMGYSSLLLLKPKGPVFIVSFNFLN